MARTKFEKYIKGKLDKRRIKPSTDAWNTLADRLDAHDNKRSNKTIWRLGIAASFIGVILMVVFFKNNEDIQPTVVDIPVEVKQDTEVELVVQEVESKEAVVNVDEIVEPVEEKAAAITTPIDSPVVIAKETPIEEVPHVLKNSTETLSFEDQKIQEVVAKVNDLKSQNSTVTEAEIDKLLLEAQWEIKSQRIINQSTGVVNADLLLQEVEMELDQSFRSKVLEAIKSGFGTVKTAVAQRNE